MVLLVGCCQDPWLPVQSRQLWLTGGTLGLGSVRTRETLMRYNIVDVVDIVRATAMSSELENPEDEIELVGTEVRSGLGLCCFENLADIKSPTPSVDKLVSVGRDCERGCKVVVRA